MYCIRFFSKLDSTSRYRRPINSQWDPLRYSGLDVCFLSQKERVMHQESRPTELSNERPCMGSKEWLIYEVQSIPTVYNKALNEEPSILKQMNTRN